MTNLKPVALRLAVFGAAACGSVHAAESAPEIASARAPVSSSIYTVELTDEVGRELATYQRGGRFYVLGETGQRYSVRVTNPTGRRIEAVLSVDGLDVIDGRPANFAGKRGYIVQPYDALVVEGFRTSDTQVATFRFSSVDASYAQRKGKGRNVGVIGVAIFEESGPPPVAVLPEPAPYHPYWHDRYRDDDYDGRGLDAESRSEAAPAPSGSPGRASSAPSAAPSKASAPSDAPSAGDAIAGRGYRERTSEAPCCGPRPKSRPGLGTEFGEARWSGVSFTRFARRHPSRPDALAEVRYNDADGLIALGILLTPAYDPDDLGLRETADPFPATGYAMPPR